MDILNERVEIPVGSARMGGFLARPQEGGPYAGVLVFMEIFGVNGHIRDVTERIAAEGYVALAPDYFHRTAPGIELGYDDEGMQRGIALLGKLDAEEMIADARAAGDFLRSRADTTEKLGAIGFCIGGHMAYLAAATSDIQAAASFYGGGITADPGLGGGASTVSRTPGIRGRLLCLFGAEDSMISAAQVSAIREALESAGTRHEVVVYPGADHGFFCDQRPSYHAASAADAWQRVKSLFADELRS